MKVTPEINKAVAEAMGLKLTTDFKVELIGKSYKDGTKSVFYRYWQPDKDAEQNDLVQEHYKIDSLYLPLCEEWHSSIYDTLVDVDHPDRKTAVVLAAYEFIINTKK